LTVQCANQAAPRARDGIPRCYPTGPRFARAYTPRTLRVRVHRCPSGRHRTMSRHARGRPSSLASFQGEALIVTAHVWRQPTNARPAGKVASLSLPKFRCGHTIKRCLHHIAEPGQAEGCGELAVQEGLGGKDVDGLACNSPSPGWTWEIVLQVARSSVKPRRVLIRACHVTKACEVESGKELSCSDDHAWRALVPERRARDADVGDIALKLLQRAGVVEAHVHRAASTVERLCS
jgi:hypothetical protein